MKYLMFLILLVAVGCDRVPQTPGFLALSSSCDGHNRIHWRVHCSSMLSRCTGLAWTGDAAEYTFHPEEWSAEGDTPDQTAANLAEKLKDTGRIYRFVGEFDS